MQLKNLVKTRQFLEEMSKSIEHIIWKSFPRLSKEEREDISQEVKLKIWRKASRGREINNLKSYLWKVVYTTTLDMITEKMEILPLGTIMDVDSEKLISRLNTFSSEALMEKRELALVIDKALNFLSENRKMVIKLYLTGMEFDEIADFLGWTRSKVNHLFYRGLSDLKKEFQKLTQWR